MEVFIMIKRKNITMFLDAKESTSVADIKKMIQGITKKPVEDQQLQLCKEEKLMEDNKTLGDYGLTSQTSKAQTPVLLGLAYRLDDGEFEVLDITPVSQPPEPPAVNKQQDSAIGS